jgi:predicted component of type VI protein secretion system
MAFQLIIIQGRGTSQTIRLADGVTTVGRQDGCQLQIRSSQVSRKHCELFEKKGLLLVRDLGSSNGTFVNGKKIADQFVLEPGAELTIGSVKFRVARTDDAPAAAVADEPIAIGSDEVIALDDQPTMMSGGAPPASPAPTPVAAETPKPAAAAPKPAAAHADRPAAGDEPIEISEDAVADFLFNIEVDEEDKI